jgi:hypothetical protein
MSDFDPLEQFTELAPGETPEGLEPTDRALQQGDVISDKIALWIVAAGPGVGQIGTQQALSQVPGRTLLQENTDYDPATFPALAAFLRPFYGESHVPPLSSPEWL